MLFILLQLDFLGQLIHIPVHDDTHVAAPLCLLEKLYMLALAPTHDRGKKLNLRPIRQCHDLIHHLVHSLFFDLFSALGTVRNTNPRVEKAKVIVDFCDSSHSGTRVAVRGFLVNGNRRGQSLNFLHIRLFHLPQKLSRIGGERFHVAPLPLRIDCVKCK